MINQNLFECSVGDKVIYVETGGTGIITRIALNEEIEFSWHILDNYSDYEYLQCISIKSYIQNPLWRYVYKYDNEQDLLILKIKYSDYNNW